MRRRQLKKITRLTVATVRYDEPTSSKRRYRRVTDRRATRAYVKRQTKHWNDDATIDKMRAWKSMR